MKRWWGSQGDWVDRIVGLEGVRSELAMMETSDGHGRLELTKFHAPPGRGVRGPAGIIVKPAEQIG